MDGFKVLSKGQKVEFELDKDDRGSVAKRVRVIS
jgi:cold shock CspA family protein